MLNRMISLTLILSFLSLPSLAQDAASNEEFLEESKNDLLMVVGGGLGGAILGLSTLSFVDEPKDHTRNILVGASLGIIGGVIFVALNQANRSKDMFYEEQQPAVLNGKEFSTSSRLAWHYGQVGQYQTATASPYYLNYTTRF